MKEIFKKMCTVFKTKEVGEGDNSVATIIEVLICTHQSVISGLKLALSLETRSHKQEEAPVETNEDRGVYYDIPISELETTLKVLSQIEERLSSKYELEFGKTISLSEDQA